MTPAQLFTLFRAEVHDLTDPPLWTDDEIYSFMDDAQKMFCRETGGIADSTSVITAVPVVAGTRAVAYDPRILKLRDVRRTSDGRGVELLNFEDLGQRYSSDYGGYNSQNNGTWNDYGQFSLYGGGVKFSDTPGPVRAAVVGMDANSLQLINLPEENDTLKLIVYRLPLVDIVEGVAALEIDPQHHRHLMLWMKALAYQKQDAEAYDRGKSIEFSQQFMAYCDQAKAERERREHKYRSVAYGGL